MAGRSRLRLLFDENLPWRVAKALKVLGLRVSYVGDESASPASPARGSPDETVLDHAVVFNQTVVTSNLDMILLCVERRQQVIWIDPWGRHFRRTDLALLAFKSIDDWTARLGSAAEPVCLRALRTKTETLNLGEAGSLVRNRMTRISKTRTRKQHPHTPGDLLPDA